MEGSSLGTLETRATWNPRCWPPLDDVTSRDHDAVKSLIQNLADLLLVKFVFLFYNVVLGTSLPSSSTHSSSVNFSFVTTSASAQFIYCNSFFIESNFYHLSSNRRILQLFSSTINGLFYLVTGPTFYIDTKSGRHEKIPKKHYQKLPGCHRLFILLKLGGSAF